MIDCSRTVFWVGAGADADQPTNLPVGNELMRFILHHVFTDGNGAVTQKTLAEQLYANRAEKMSEFCNYMNTVYSAGFPEIHNTIRLETVISVLREFEERASDNGTLMGGDYSTAHYLDGFKSFAEAKPNMTHIALAYLMHEGATLVTANYDNCILKAYRYLYGINLTEHKLTNQIYELKYEANNVDKGCVNPGSLFYYHGVAWEPESLGITLQTIDNPFQGEFLEKVKSYYRNGSTFFFIGYGCVDNFDVNVMFHRLAHRYRNFSNTSAVCVLYPGKDGNAKLSEDQKELLECFPNYDAVVMRLPDLFGSYLDVWKGATDDIKKKVSDYYKAVKNVEIPDGWWAESFISPNKDYIESINRQLDYTLGIERVNPDKAKPSPHTKSWHKRFYFPNLFRRKFEPLIKIIAPDKLDSGRWLHSVKQSIELLESNEGKDAGEKINWISISAVNHRCKEMWMMFPMISAKKTMRLLSAIDTVLNTYSIADFTAPRARFVLYYDKARLEYMLYRDWVKSKSDILEGISLYISTSELEGIANGIKLYVDVLRRAVRSKKVMITREEYRIIESMSNDCIDQRYGKVFYK